MLVRRGTVRTRELEAEGFGVLRRVGSAPSPGQRRCSHHWCPPSAWREGQIYRDRWRGTSTWDIANIDGHWGREGFWGGEPTATSLLPFSSANTSATERTFINQGTSRGNTAAGGGGGRKLHFSSSARMAEPQFVRIGSKSELGGSLEGCAPPRANF